MKFFVSFFFFVFAVVTFLRADISNEIDRKKTIFRVDSLNENARRLTYINPVLATENANEALLLATEIDFQTGKGYAYRNLGGLYSAAENFSLSFEFLEQSLELFSNSADSIGIANCYITLGHTYRRLFKRDEEYFYHKSALGIFKRAGKVERAAVSMHNLGETLFLMDSLRASKSLTIQALSVLDSLKLYDVSSNCHKVLGQIALKNLDLQTAKKHFTTVLEISETLGEQSQKEALIEAQLQLAEIARIRGDNVALEKNLLAAAESAKSYLAIKQALRVYTGLIQFYLNIGNPIGADLAGRSFLQALEREEARQARDRSRLMELAKTSFDLKKKVRTMESENQLQAARIKSRNFVIGFSFLFLVVSSFLLYLRYRSAKNLRKANQQLILKQQTILSQNEKLEELNLTKDRFFGIVAHDLKAPLSSLKMFSDLSSEILQEMDPKDLNRFFESMGRSVDDTLKMADNLIMWASIQMKDVQMRPSEVVLKDVFEAVFRIYSSIAQQKNVELICTISENVSVFADPDQLAFVIRNLINNALKFTPNGGRVVAQVVEQQPGNVVFSIEDTGVGIAADKIGQLFEVGRSRSTLGTNGEKGTGLGLVLIHDFVTMNAGSIRVKSELGKGSTFIISLPNSKAS